MQCQMHVIHRALPLQRPAGAPQVLSVEADVSEQVFVVVERACKLLGEITGESEGGAAPVADGASLAVAVAAAGATTNDANASMSDVAAGLTSPSLLRRPRVFYNGNMLDPRRALSDYRFANGQTALFLLDCRPYFPSLTPALFAGTTRPKYLITRSPPAGSEHPAFKYQKVKKLINCIYGNVTMYVKVYLQADGVTYAARDQHEYFAVKKMVKRKMHFYNSAVAPSSEDPLMELSIQQFLGMAIAGGHPFVCRLHECCEDAENIYAIMEALQGGDCFEFCINSSSKTSTGASAAAIPEDIARVLYTQIVLGLKHMFDCKVSHCDLTLENVMLTRDKKRAVIIDFGESKDQFVFPKITKKKSRKKNSTTPHPPLAPSRHTPPLTHYWSVMLTLKLLAIHIFYSPPRRNGQIHFTTHAITIRAPSRPPFKTRGGKTFLCASRVLSRPNWCVPPI